MVPKYIFQDTHPTERSHQQFQMPSHWQYMWQVILTFLHGLLWIHPGLCEVASMLLQLFLVLSHEGMYVRMQVGRGILGTIRTISRNAQMRKLNLLWLLKKEKSLGGSMTEGYQILSPSTWEFDLGLILLLCSPGDLMRIALSTVLLSNIAYGQSDPTLVI